MADHTTSNAAEIRLEDLTKVYPGTDEPAVDAVTMTIPAGEIVVLVGPSGCGKTTTLRMINRLVEPTSGRIFLDDEDVTDTHPDTLRRRMGYAIQKTGLFPHLTIRENVATVPRLLDWDRQRINDRVEELLDLVGLDPARYADRYPRELSGGQQQRVGVARAMAADPPVMLMDEPFGATDPITRERLQNEFLRIQREVGKTIVFVTHDIDEAIKMGDRIAILGDQSIIQQYDTPETILAGPANEFVEDFIGSGASLKGLNLARVRDVEYGKQWPTRPEGTSPNELRAAMRDADQPFVLLLDDATRPTRWIAERDLDRVSDGALPDRAGTPVEAVVEPHATLADALNEMLTGAAGCAVVIDGDRSYLGTLDMETVSAAIRRMRERASERSRSQLAETAGT